MATVADDPTRAGAATPSVLDLVPAAPDAKFDAVAALARRLLDVPLATVSIIAPDEHRLPGAAVDGAFWEESRSVPLDYSICKYAVADRAPLILPDTRASERVAQVPSVVEGRVRAYAGIPLADLAGETVGTLCVTSDRPREWTDDELDLMTELAALCASELQLRQASAQAAVAADRDRIVRALASDVFGELLQLSMTLAGLQAMTTGDAAATSRAATETVDKVLKNIRRTIFDARPRD